MYSLAYSNNKDIYSSFRTSTEYNETTDNLNHNSLETNKTYTIINITFNGSSKEVRQYYKLISRLVFLNYSRRYEILSNLLVITQYCCITNTH